MKRKRCIKGTNGNWKKIVSVSDEVKCSELYLHGMEEYHNE